MNLRFPTLSFIAGWDGMDLEEYQKRYKRRWSRRVGQRKNVGSDRRNVKTVDIFTVQQRSVLHILLLYIYVINAFHPPLSNNKFRERKVIPFVKFRRIRVHNTYYSCHVHCWWKFLHNWALNGWDLARNNGWTYNCAQTVGGKTRGSDQIRKSDFISQIYASQNS